MGAPGNGNGNGKRVVLDFAADSYEASESALAAMRNGGPEIPWGYLELDRVFGGTRQGWLTVVGAKPGNGKTTLLLNMANALFAEAVGQDHRIAYFGTECEPEVLYRKLAACRLGLNEEAVIKNDWEALPQGAEAAVYQNIKMLGLWTNRLCFPRCPRVSVPDVADLLDAITQPPFGANVVFFDHLHRVWPGPRQDERQAVTELVRLFKTVAVERHCAIITASQLKRDDAGVFERYRPPYLSSFMWSSAVEQEADVAVGLFRPVVRMTPADERAVKLGHVPMAHFAVKDRMAVRCVKHRWRPSANDETVRLRVDGPRILDEYGPGATPPPGAGDAWEPVEDDATGTRFP